MPDISVGNQLFDLAFHPSSDVVCASTVAGEVKCYRYNDQGEGSKVFACRVSKRSCRGLDFSFDGQSLYAVTKDSALYTLDPQTGSVKQSKADAHSSAINRLSVLNDVAYVTGDDEGVIKLWDPRKPDAIREFTHHHDFISDFTYVDSKRQLVSTSGDATLSVIDIRSNKSEPIARSEDQEDELLSVVPTKSRTRFVVGTQSGVLAIFDPAKGWGDCVDRIPGHPESVDALVELPGAGNVIITGSSDGMIRMLQVYPNKLLGVVGDHGEFPIERMKVSRDGRWLGSASHDEVLKLTDIKDCLEDSDEEKDADEQPGKEDSDSGTKENGGDSDSSSSDEEVEVETKKRKKKRTRDPLGIKTKKANTTIPNFFADL